MHTWVLRATITTETRPIRNTLEPENGLVKGGTGTGGHLDGRL